MHQVTVTDLRQNMRDILDELMQGYAPVEIVRGAKPVAVLMSASDYQALVTKEPPPPKQPAPIHW